MPPWGLTVAFAPAVGACVCQVCVCVCAGVQLVYMGWTAGRWRRAGVHMHACRRLVRRALMLLHGWGGCRRPCGFVVCVVLWRAWYGSNHPATYVPACIALLLRLSGPLVAVLSLMTWRQTNQCVCAQSVSPPCGRLRERSHWYSGGYCVVPYTVAHRAAAPCWLAVWPD